MTNFKTHYATLARIAARLEEGEADIDEVLPLLEEAKVAYAACQARLEAVRLVLGDLDLPQDAEDSSEDSEAWDEEDEE